jgi:predicted nucleic acid-binding protein
VYGSRHGPPQPARHSPLKVVADTGPLLAALDRRDEAHALASELVTQLGRDLIVPEPVIFKVDQLARACVGAHEARVFLAALDGGEHEIAYLSPGILNRAIEIDRRYGGLHLGLVSAAVMALAESHKLPILTFDFERFRAARPSGGSWQLVVDEGRYAGAVGH